MLCPVSRRFVAMALVAAVALAACGGLQAKNVDLSTVPKRESVQLTILAAGPARSDAWHRFLAVRPLPGGVT